MPDQEIPSIRIRCDYCGNEHEATFSHIGEWSKKPVYVAECWQADGTSLADYYTDEAAL